MKRALLILAVLLFAWRCRDGLRGQGSTPANPPEVPPPNTPGSFYALGMSALPQSSPKPTGFAAIAVLASAKAQIWSFSEMDFTLVKPGRAESGCNVGGCVQTSVLSGIATPLRQVGSWTLYALGAGGAATTGNTSGGALSGGAILYIPLRKTQSAFIIGYEALRGPMGVQEIVKLGWGRLISK